MSNFDSAPLHTYDEKALCNGKDDFDIITVLSSQLEERLEKKSYIESFVIVFNWNHFDMSLLNLRINFLFIADFLSSSWKFLCCFFFHYVSAKFHLRPSSGD